MQNKILSINGDIITQENSILSAKINQAINPYLGGAGTTICVVVLAITIYLKNKNK